jgi:ribose 5-phosphate isomerase A
VKGRGGALLWEKLVAELCDRFVIVASSEKLVPQLGTRLPLPVEIVSLGWRQTAARLAAFGCQGRLRTAGDGSPFVTDGGHYIFDCEPGPIAAPRELAATIKAVTGVVDHGLFIDLTTAAITIDEQGTISEMTARRD